jgi:hypothetical protein
VSIELSTHSRKRHSLLTTTTQQSCYSVLQLPDPTVPPEFSGVEDPRGF